MPKYRRIPKRIATAPVVVASAQPAAAAISVDEPVASADAPVVDPATLKKDDLVNLAAAAGVDTSGTKADIIGRLK